MVDPARYLDLLSRPVGATGLEGAESSRGSLPDKQELLDRLQAEIAYIQRKTGLTADPGQIHALVSQADEGLSRLLGDGPGARLGLDEVAGLEAVIRTDGSRPVLFVEDDFVDVMAPSAGDYAAGLSRLEDARTARVPVRGPGGRPNGSDRLSRHSMDAGRGPGGHQFPRAEGDRAGR